MTESPTACSHLGFIWGKNVYWSHDTVPGTEWSQIREYS